MRTIWARAILSAAMLVIILPMGAEASPWGQDRENSLNITKLDYYRSEESDRSFDQILLETYVEQGFSEMWSLGGKLGQGWQTLRSEDMTALSMRSFSSSARFLRATDRQAPFNCSTALRPRHAPPFSAPMWMAGTQL